MAQKIITEINAFANKFIYYSDIDLSEKIKNLSYLLCKETMQNLNFINVQGFLDDLIGQRMFIEVILFILCFCIIILFIVFM